MRDGGAVERCGFYSLKPCIPIKQANIAAIVLLGLWLTSKKK